MPRLVWACFVARLHAAQGVREAWARLALGVGEASADLRFVPLVKVPGGQKVPAAEPRGQ